MATTELEVRRSTELDFLDDTSLWGRPSEETLEAVKEWLAEATDVVDVARLRKAADSAAAPGKVGTRRLKARDKAITAAEVQVRCERWLGLRRNQIPWGRGGRKAPHRPRTDFDDAVGLTSNEGLCCSRIAQMTEEAFEAAIRSRVEQNYMPTVQAIIQRWLTSGVRRIETGIYLLPDGRFQVRYGKNNGQKKNLQGPRATDISYAREQRVLLLGFLREHRKSLGNLDKVAEQLRYVVASIDETAPTLFPDARRQANEAYEHLKKGEDALNRLLLMLSAPGGAWGEAAR